MIKVQTTSKEIYVVALPEGGGAWLPSEKFYTNRDLAKRIVDERRSQGEKVQLFALFEYIEEKTCNAS